MQLSLNLNEQAKKRIPRPTDQLIQKNSIEKSTAHRGIKSQTYTQTESKITQGYWM